MIMNDKFKQIPVEIDTTIISRKEVNVASYEALYEIWSWDGVTAESIIFDSKDVAHLTDSEIEEMILTLSFFKRESSVTLKRSTDFTFVNFNFTSNDEKSFDIFNAVLTKKIEESFYEQ
jgi:hypothetical protein